VVFAVTPTGILVATDSKGVRISGGDTRRPLGSIEKAFIIQDRLVVASVGTAVMNFTRPGHPEDSTRYNFAEWMTEIKKECPRNLSVSALTSLIESKSRNTFKNVSKVIASGTLDRKKTFDPLIEYYVAGYDTGVPSITHIYYRVDWENRRLSDPVTEVVHPSKNAPGVDNDFFDVGITEVGAEIADAKGNAYKELLSMIPNEMPKLYAGKILSIPEATDSCLAVLRYQTKHHPTFVGPPFVVTIIPLDGKERAIRTVYSK
jgi:hypothetical protein